MLSELSEARLFDGRRTQQRHCKTSACWCDVSALAKHYGISTERVRQIFAREVRKELRQQELAEADRRPDQPNLLHLEPGVRALLADFCGKVQFTPDDVEERGFRRDNFSCEERVWLRIVRWMALAGKKPAKPPYQQTVNEWIEYQARHSGKRP